MNKAEYLAELEKRLGALRAEERADLLADYEAHFEHGRASGRSDEEIAQRLGAPQLAAREILYQLSVDRARAHPTLPRISRAVFAGAGRGLVNVLVLLVPFLTGLVGAGLIVWVLAVKAGSMFIRWMLSWLQRNVRMTAGERA